MKQRKKYIIPVFIPQQGCPFQCIYCNQYAITGVKRDILAEVDEVLRKAIVQAPKDIDIEIAFYGGTFTAMDKDIQRSLLEKVSAYRDCARIIGIRLSTRPDYIDSSILDMLSFYGVTTIELGAQSMVNDVLKASGRGHSAEDIEKAARLIKSCGMQLGIQLMIGLPGDDKERDMTSVFKAINTGADFVRIYPTLVIKDTPLQRLYDSDRYKPLSLDDAVDISADMLCACIAMGVKVIRIGLQPSDGIQLGCDVIAGPFHPAFGELVKSRIYLGAMMDLLGQTHHGKGYMAVISVSQKELSIALGQKRSNLQTLKERFELERVEIVPSQHIRAGNIRVEIIHLPQLLTLYYSCADDQMACIEQRYDLSITDYCRKQCRERYGHYVS